MGLVILLERNYNGYFQRLLVLGTSIAHTCLSEVLILGIYISLRSLVSSERKTADVFHHVLFLSRDVLLKLPVSWVYFVQKSSMPYRSELV